MEDGETLPKGAAVYVVVVENAQDEQRKGTLHDFLNSPLVGLWKDREDIEDGSSFAAKLRRDAEKRERS